MHAGNLAGVPLNPFLSFCIAELWELIGRAIFMHEDGKKICQQQRIGNVGPGHKI